jgi:hypothetical protein
MLDLTDPMVRKAAMSIQSLGRRDKWGHFLDALKMSAMIRL